MSSTIMFEQDPGVHVSTFPWISETRKKGRYQKKRMLLYSKEVYPVSVYVLAAVELQRIWRGVLLRRRVLKAFLSGDFVRQWKVEEKKFKESYNRVPRASEAQFVALTRRVQARWRTVLLRKEHLRLSSFSMWPIYYVAAATIQRAWVDYRFHAKNKRHRQRSRKFFLTKDDAAASKIQQMWRGKLNKQVFQFYVDLIRFRERGDPMLMLKSINPGEANLVDPAAGLHVRFRLGGATFPPTIFYKIFTHNNVADVCAFAPKDYTVSRKHKTPAMVHNQISTGQSKDRRGWYRRVENNPWRPVTQSVLENAEEIVQQASKYVLATNVVPESASFHYSKLKRQEDVEMKAKKTRRKWLAELYASEKAHTRGQSIGEAKSDAIRVFDQMDENAIDAEVEKLTEWTDQLNFEQYRKDWLGTATTASSDALAATRRI